jgi:ribosomal protein S6--L-glutamate ligase
VALIEDRQALRDWAAGHDVLYVQERLPIERDVRVTVVGDQVVAAYWRKAPQGGFHNNIARGGELGFDHVPPQAISVVADLARHLKIDHAGFDVALVDGHPFILEFNVLFGNGGLEPLGVKLADIIHQYLCRETPGPTLQVMS